MRTKRAYELNFFKHFFFKTLFLVWQVLFKICMCLPLPQLLTLSKKIVAWIGYVKLRFIFTNLPSELEYDTNIIPGLILLAASWVCWTSWKNRCVQILVLHLLVLLQLGSSSKYGQSKSFLHEMVTVPYFRRRSTPYLIGCLIFIWPFQDALRLSLLLLLLLRIPPCECVQEVSVLSKIHALWIFAWP